MRGHSNNNISVNIALTNCSVKKINYTLWWCCVHWWRNFRCLYF